MKFIIKFDNKNNINDNIKRALAKKLDKALNDISDFIGNESDRILRDPDDGTFDTGFLANSRVVDKERFLYKEIGYSALYAPYIEYGTEPHHPPIKPIYDWLNHKKKDLNIKIKSKEVVTLKDGNTYNVSLLKITMAIIKTIEKKGTEEHPFLRPSFNLGKSKTNEFIKRSIGGK